MKRVIIWVDVEVKDKLKLQTIELKKHSLNETIKYLQEQYNTKK